MLSPLGSMKEGVVPGESRRDMLCSSARDRRNQ